MKKLTLLFIYLLISTFAVKAETTKLLRQPDVSTDKIVFIHGSDVWTCNLDGNNVKRITSTAAAESNPYFSPDGKTIAFTSNRMGSSAVYTVPTEGGMPVRLTWHPSGAFVRGWTPDGKSILYASSRDSAPSGFNSLWKVDAKGGPSVKLFNQWGYDGSYSPNGKKMALDRMSRWDSEWRAYRGGQNTPLIIIDLETLAEELIPNDKTTDIQPIWIGDEVFFLSDRDWNMNVWAYNTSSKNLRQVTNLKDTDVKWLGSNNDQLIIEQAGVLHLVDKTSGAVTTLDIEVVADFPWAATKWEDVSRRARSVSLSPTGKRVLMEARGEIFTVPAEYGNSRNLTTSSGSADRYPIWSPKGDKIAYFSDKSGDGYALILADQEGKNEEAISIGESKLGWTPTWSPDGKMIAFVDDDVRIRVLDLETKEVKTVDVGGNNLDRTRTAPTWSPLSDKLAYVKSGSNNFRQIKIWDKANNTTKALTNEFADAFAPSWDLDEKHFYFLASTDLALRSGWANTSSMQGNPSYAPYVIVLQEGVESPFIPRSDEEKVEEPKEEKEDKKEEEKEDDKKENSKEEESEDKKEDKEEEVKLITIDYDRIERRTIALPLPSGNYIATDRGPKGSFFLAERKSGQPGLILHKFTLKDREAKEFASGVSQFSTSADAKKILIQSRGSWSIAGAGGPSGKGGKSVKVNLKMKLDREAEWTQMFEEAWRYQRDYFYDPNIHGRDWNKVYKRYAPLAKHIKHRSDLNYVLDMMNGELSVGHSFVFGGDFPDLERNETGLLGADLAMEGNAWKIERIYHTESWNPNLSSPLDRPGLKVEEGNYLVGINGEELTANIDPYMLLDGTRGKQTTLHFNSKPGMEDSWEEIVEPISSERALRQRAWVEDNRRMVDELSGGRLAYIWVPNTGGPGYVSFNRYFFAQQDKEGAIIDERFNGGGLLDDYMVDLMTRSLRAAITNEVPNGSPMRLPAGILGPKVLLVNELAGSGGDFFPWVFRQQQAGQLIGATTWGGLVKSSVHYSLIDGGALTAPDNAVFDPINNKYIGENEGIAPDIAVRQDAQSLEEGKDPQLARGVQELLKILDQQKQIKVANPPYNTPAKKN